MTIFFQGGQHVYFAKVMLIVSLNGNPVIKLIMQRDEIHKKNQTMFCMKMLTWQNIRYKR